MKFSCAMFLLFVSGITWALSEQNVIIGVINVNPTHGGLHSFQKNGGVWDDTTVTCDANDNTLYADTNDSLDALSSLLSALLTAKTMEQKVTVYYTYSNPSCYIDSLLIQ